LTFINCEISNITQITDLTDHPFHLYKPFGGLSFINCTITGVAQSSYLTNVSGGIAEISFSNTPVSYADPNCHDDTITFAPKTTNIVVIYD